MLPFRINRGGLAVVIAVLLTGIAAMPDRFTDGMWLGILTVLSLLLHECGHILAARILGVKAREFGICLKGSYVRREKAPQPIEEAAIALSGPLVNTLIAALLWGVPGVGHWLAIFNLVLSISNLAPLPGSDGRRALHAWDRTVIPARIPIPAQERKKPLV